MKVEICKLDRNRNIDRTNISWLVQAIDSFSRIPISVIESYDLGNASNTFSYYALAAFETNKSYSTQYLLDTRVLAPELRNDLKKLLAKNAKNRKKGEDEPDKEIAEANKNPATLASMCRNIGLLEDHQDSIRLTPFAKCLFIIDKVLVEEYVFALLAKQWVKVDGVCKRPLLCVIFDLCKESKEFLLKLQSQPKEAALLVAKSVVGGKEEDIELEKAKMDILKNHLLLSGLFTCAPNKEILLTPKGRVILQSFREKEELIPKYSNDDFLEYIGKIDNGAFAAIDHSNASTFNLLYPNLVRIILKLKNNMFMNTFSAITPIIIYGPPGTGKTHRMQTKYISNYDKKDRFVTTFHQSFSYEEFVEGLKPLLVVDENGNPQEDQDASGDVKYQVVKGIFRIACDRAAELAGYKSLKDCIEDSFDNRQKKVSQAINDNKTVLLCIDEINRGNIAAIFGDLISLIEDNKRLGVNEQTELIVTLPYSQDLFGVPANLLIVGTMNTADRSIQLLDSALRRRFKFEEQLPNYDKISNPDAKKILEIINSRIRCLLNKDNQIGHSYLMNVETNYEIINVITNKIIPLLEEYFYNEIEKVRFVLNEDGNTNYPFYIEDSKAQTAYQLFDIDKEEKSFFILDEKVTTLTDEAECGKYLKHLLGEKETEDNSQVSNELRDSE